MVHERPPFGLRESFGFVDVFVALPVFVLHNSLYRVLEWLEEGMVHFLEDVYQLYHIWVFG